MKKYTVQIARIEHRIYQIEFAAENATEAEDLAMEIWENDDEAFTDMGCVHAEEFVHEVKPAKVAA